MKKILLSLGSILSAAALVAGGTGAFLHDSGTSTGNTFATGVIDLKIDNESYVTDEWGKLVYSSSTSWALSTLAGKLFFDFDDLKPGDIGEDTISLHVNDNNAWACMFVRITGTPENGQNDPELLSDATLGANDGELEEYLNFVFWADDGDNVFEKGEKIWKRGLAKDIFDGKYWTLADSSGNIWDGQGPVRGGTTKYIGKSWCFGSVTDVPVAQDGKGKTGTNGPLARGTGFRCDGKDVGNIVQSDGITADVGFSVAQSRGNGDYLCSGGDRPKEGSISGAKFHDKNKNGKKDSGEPTLSGWTIGISSGGATTTTVTGTIGTYSFDGLAAGDYLVCESDRAGWVQTYPTPKCWKVTLAVGEQATGKDFGNWKKPTDYGYCSPGYWKQERHSGNCVGYSPDKQFSQVFENAFPGKTLRQVLESGGGGLDALGRATVAALYNAGKLESPYSQREVIAMFNGAYPGTNSSYEKLAEKFTLPENCSIDDENEHDKSYGDRDDERVRSDGSPHYEKR